MDKIDKTSDLVISLPITSAILWFIWLVMVIIFIVVSWMLHHHWKYYGVKGNHRIFAKALYFVIGITILIVLAIFIGAYGVIK